MAEILVNKIFFFSLILVLQIEFFFFLCYDYMIFFVKSLRINKINKLNIDSYFLNYNKLVLSFILLYLITLKSINLFSILLMFYLLIISYWLISIIRGITFFVKTDFKILNLICFLFFGLIFFLINISSFLSFFFFIELYGVLYFFIFLNSYKFTNLTLLKYKNGLLFLLWNNFLTTVFISLSCLYLFKLYGTTNFTELSFLTTSSNCLYFFFFGIAWKLGLPGFHFFKLEVYKYLLKENVFFFSSLTILFNIVIFFYFFQIPIVFNTFYLNNWLIICFVFLINLILFNLKLTNLLYFFALSGVITLTMLLSLLII